MKKKQTKRGGTGFSPCGFLETAAVLLALCSATQAALPVTAIAAGGQHSVALTSDGTVWSWGPLPEKVGGHVMGVQDPPRYFHELLEFRK